ncbi:MAG: N-glycosylase/DNA lyase [Acidobacteriota bacterium]
MKNKPAPVTIDGVKAAYMRRKHEIRQRLGEFESIRSQGSDHDLWEEMVFCFFTGGCSAKMGLRSIEAVRPILVDGTQDQLARALTGVHRYPNARARYIAESREFLHSAHRFEIRSVLDSFNCPLERRDWLVREKGIKGLGYKEASHFLRNIGFRGYAILDKHVLKCLCELKIIAEPKPPNTRSRYLTIELQLRDLSEKLEIGFDEMDLVLWSMKTGEILK